MSKKHGHYCKVCGEYKSNESFSGSGPCGAHLQEVRRTACRPAVRDDDSHQAVESAVAAICTSELVIYNQNMF